MRLQKYMASAGVASRRQCEELISTGRVSVNGQIAQIGLSVVPGEDVVELDGTLVVLPEQRVVLLFNKPRGVVCTSHDPEGRKTIQAYFENVPERLHNVGRLDINSEGLLIMTNDGAITDRLTHPRFEVEKTYFVVCNGMLSTADADTLRCGVQLTDGMTAPAIVEHIAKTKSGDTSFEITIHEGRNRQVRRMLEAVGYRTLLLRRVRIGELYLGDLHTGQWRNASIHELAWIDRMINK